MGGEGLRFLLRASCGCVLAYVTSPFFTREAAIDGNQRISQERLLLLLGCPSRLRRAMGLRRV